MAAEAALEVCEAGEPAAAEAEDLGPAEADSEPLPEEREYRERSSNPPPRAACAKAFAKGLASAMVSEVVEGKEEKEEQHRDKYCSSRADLWFLQPTRGCEERRRSPIGGPEEEEEQEEEEEDGGRFQTTTGSLFCARNSAISKSFESEKSRGASRCEG